MMIVMKVEVDDNEVKPKVNQDTHRVLTARIPDVMLIKKEKVHFLIDITVS